LKSKSKIIVLMTDGANNSGKIDPITATQAAQALGVKIYTIGMGNREIVEQMGLPEGFLPDLDTLQKMSQMTGGKSYAGDNSEKLRSIYDEIDKMEKTEAVVNKYTQYKELYSWFILGGAVVLLLEIALAQTIFRRLP
jgi:Ca-activated chloride channel family protein